MVEELQEALQDMLVGGQLVFGAFRHLAQSFLIFRQVTHDPGHKSVSVGFPFLLESPEG